jgi:Immunity protein 27
MIKPSQLETVILGQWILKEGQIFRDPICLRIEDLISNYFLKIGDSQESGEWETLFKDPNDGRLWERTFPNGELHGGGPPKLSIISEQTARIKYSFFKPS